MLPAEESADGTKRGNGESDNETPVRSTRWGDISGMQMLAWQIGLGIVLALLWQAASGRLVDDYFISNPAAVGKRLIAWFSDGSIFPHLWATLYATIVGFVIGSVIGGVLGVWLGMSPFVARLTGPYLWATNALPLSSMR